MFCFFKKNSNFFYNLIFINKILFNSIFLLSYEYVVPQNDEVGMMKVDLDLINDNDADI